MKERRRLSLMTVFLPRENIFFIEEWLKYHIIIGFDHFFLYNNMGSRFMMWGHNIEVDGKNRRGENVYSLLKDRTDDEVEKDLNRIIEPFIKKGYVTQVKWQPRDRGGSVTYAQGLAFIDYIKKYSRGFDWVCFTDMDEFIVPVRHDNLQDLLDEIEREGLTNVILPQRCFAPRFDENGNPVKEVVKIFQCGDWVTSEFGAKGMIKTNTLRIPWRKAGYSIHYPPVHKRKSKFVSDENLVRFNHYKFNQRELAWVAKHLNRVLELNERDKGMMRFYDEMKAFRME